MYICMYVCVYMHECILCMTVHCTYMYLNSSIVLSITSTHVHVHVHTVQYTYGIY